MWAKLGKLTKNDLVGLVSVDSPWGKSVELDSDIAVSVAKKSLGLCATFRFFAKQNIMFCSERGGYLGYPLTMAGNETQQSGSRMIAGFFIAVVALCLFALLFLAGSCSLASYANPSASSDPLVAAASTSDTQMGIGSNSQDATSSKTSSSNTESSDSQADSSSSSSGANSEQDSNASNSDASKPSNSENDAEPDSTTSGDADNSSVDDSSGETAEPTENSDAGAQSLDGDDESAAAAVAETSSTDSDSYGDDIDAVAVYPRVLVDGVWKYVGKDGGLYDSNTDAGFTPITVTKQASRAGGNRAIVPASVLEGVLSQFGFSADSELKRADKDYSSGDVDWGNFVFGYCDSGVGIIYNDVSPQLVTADDGISSWYVFTKGREWIHQDTGDKSLDLFYLPANRNDGEFDTPSSFFAETSRDKTNAQVIADNSFYSVTVSDGGNRIYGADDTRPSGFVNTNAGASKRTFTVKKPGENYNWKIEAADGCTATVENVTDNSDGTLTYTLSGVTGPVALTAVDYDANKFDIVYKAEMENSDRTQLGNVAASDQVITENTTIGEGDDEAGTLTIPVDATGQSSYTLLAPNSDIATAYWTQRTTRKFIYSFMGWRIVGDAANTVYASGDEIPFDTLKTLARNTGSVNIKSVWSAQDTNTSSPHIRSANFYLNLNCEILDVDGSSSSAGSDSYTESIYSTRVSGTDTFGAGDFTLLSSESSTSAYDVDKKIRNATSSGTPIKPPSSWTSYTQDGVTFERFPTDEEVLQQVRNLGSQIKIDDEVISTENLTSSNFTVRWYVVKYDTTDGWHIDGVLVAKKARLVVSKTFEGETDALEAFKAARGYSSLDEFDKDDDFYVDVTHEATVSGATTDVTDYKLLLIPDSDLDHTDTTDRRYGYTSYDEATNTYTWEIDARQDRLYTVKENNYYLDTDSWNNLTWYEVRNSNSTYNTNGWTEYDVDTGASVKVLAAAYPTDVPSSAWQAIGFRNAYVHKGTLAVFKNDYTTGAAMANVAFEVEQTDTSATTALYRKKGTNEYTTDTAVVEQHADVYEKVTDGKAVTDANGVFFLSLAAPDESSTVTATYVLKEQKDTAVGYDGPDTITFSMTYNNGITDGKVETTGGSSEVTWAKAGDNKFILNIYNRSTEYTSVTAKKQWADGTTSPKPVTVQLWRKYGSVEEPVPSTGANGKSVLVDVDGNEASNEVQLSKDNSWTFSWGSLPLFINNEQVGYSLRETWIGDPASNDSAAYDAEADPEDGYADYAVTTEDARYVAGDMPDTVNNTGDELRKLYPQESCSWEADDGSTTYANHVLLMINNAEVKGIISFTKKDRAGLDGKPLSGATFTLYSDADCTKKIEDFTTEANGLVAFSKQASGTYYIKETKAPAGYSFDVSAVYKAVVSNGSPVITKVGDASQTAITSLYNKFGAGLNIKKIGEGDVSSAPGVSGAKFRLAKIDGTGDWAEAHELTTDVNGGLTFTGIDQGTYTLTEVQSAAGYEASSGISLEFSVETDEETGKTSFKLSDDSVINPDGDNFVGWADSSSEDNVAYTLTVRNTALASLPTTGGIGIAAFAFVGFGLMALATYRYYRNCRSLGRHGKRGGLHA